MVDDECADMFWENLGLSIVGTEVLTVVEVVENFASGAHGDADHEDAREPLVEASDALSAPSAQRFSINEPVTHTN